MEINKEGISICEKAYIRACWHSCNNDWSREASKRTLSSESLHLLGHINFGDIPLLLSRPHHIYYYLMWQK